MTQNRVAVVTGGGSGIGRAAALELASNGFAVVVSGRRADRLEQVRAEISAADGRGATCPGDVADPDYCQQLIDYAVQVFGRLDALVTAAAICDSGDIATVTAEDWDRTINVNLRGSALCAAAAARQMRSQGEGGHIVLVSSVNGFASEMHSAQYSASKSAIMSLARSLAVDLADDQIAANAIAPGWVHTEMTAPWLAKASDHQVKGINPVGRLGEPEEIARVIAFLASSPRFLTGATVSVDGGQTAIAPLP